MAKFKMRSVAFVHSHINVLHYEAVPIADWGVFRKARPKEVVRIKEALQRHSTRFGPRYTYPYEGTIEWGKDPGDSVGRFKKLPRTQWKYWVVACEKQVLEHDIQPILLLGKTDIELGLSLIYQNGKPAGYTIQPGRVMDFGYTMELRVSKAIDVEIGEIKALRKYYELARDLPNEHVYVREALENFNSLRRLPEASDVLAVGLFAVMEALVTHRPRSAETLDSITHQISNKLVLLKKRFEREVDYAQYFDVEDPVDGVKVWKKLYSYRSDIAHGTRPHLESKLKLLRSKEAILTGAVNSLHCGVGCDILHV